MGTAVFTVADWLLPPWSAICVAVPAVPVAVKVMGLPMSPLEAATRVLGAGRRANVS